MKRTFALFLAALLTIAAALPVLADDRVQPPAEPASSAAAETGAALPPAAGAETDGSVSQAAAPDSTAPSQPGATELPASAGVLTVNSVQSAPLAAENTSDTLNFENLRRALERYNANIISLEGQIKDLGSVTSVDMWNYIVMLDQMKEGLDAALRSMGTAPDGMEAVYEALEQSLAAQSVILEIQIESLRGQRESMSSIETAKNSLQDAINQIIKGAETLYVGITAMEDGLTAMNRGLEAMDRAVAIVEKQKELGMASAYDVERMHYQRRQLQSQMESLKFQIASNKITLEGMCDMELNGSVQLGALPLPAQAELDAVSYDKNLSAAMGRNVDVMNAESKYNAKPDSVPNKKAVTAAKSSFAAKFKTVCMAVPENVRLVSAAQETVDFQQRTFDIAAKKYELGMASHEEYLSAQSDLDGAKDDLNTARRNLFSAYRAYVNATQYGLV